MTSSLVRSCLASCIASTTLLAGCGGGGGDPGGSGPPPTSATAEGAYAGTATRTIAVNAPPVVVSNDLQMLVLDDGTFWAVYGFTSGGVARIAGFVNGSGVSNNGTFTSSSTQDFGFSSPPSGSLTATYAAKASMQGTVTDTTGNIAFNGTAVAASSYNYDVAASLQAVQGSWNMLTLVWAPATLTVSATGTLAGSADGCSFTGTLTPSAKGKNYFVAALTYGAAPCTLAGQISTGIAVASTLADGRRQLAIVGVIPARTAGTALIGAR